MKVLTLRTSLGIQRILQVAGLSLVILVNTFVFLSDTSLLESSRFESIRQMVYHASEQHQVNSSPFKIQLSFNKITLQEMQPPPLPSFPPQYFFGIYAFMISLVVFTTHRFDLIRGEENKMTVIPLSRISPPPEKI